MSKETSYRRRNRRNELNRRWRIRLLNEHRTGADTEWRAMSWLHRGRHDEAKRYHNDPRRRPNPPRRVDRCAPYLSDSKYPAMVTGERYTRPDYDMDALMRAGLWRDHNRLHYQAVVAHQQAQADIEAWQWNLSAAIADGKMEIYTSAEAKAKRRRCFEAVNNKRAAIIMMTIAAALNGDKASIRRAAIMGKSNHPDKRMLIINKNRHPIYRARLLTLDYYDPDTPVEHSYDYSKYAPPAIDALVKWTAGDLRQHSDNEANHQAVAMRTAYAVGSQFKRIDPSPPDDGNDQYRRHKRKTRLIWARVMPRLLIDPDDHPRNARETANLDWALGGRACPVRYVGRPPAAAKPPQPAGFPYEIRLTSGKIKKIIA